MTATTPPSTTASRRTAARRLASLHPVNKVMVDDAPRGARIADAVTGFMGSWNFIAIQTVIVVIWIAGNVALFFHFDIYPFILLNLAFSTQAAYAAPLILLAATRQSDRDRLTAIADAKHREAIAELQATVLAQNSDTTDLVRKLVAEIHAHVCEPA
jgi:uncharacterized membrane protein